MLKSTVLPLLLFVFATALPGGELARVPAVPLVAHDPYFSIWSPADRLADADTVHWTGKPHRLFCQARIDGQTFRLLGKQPADMPALPQTGAAVLPTRTQCTFEGEGVRLVFSFCTPALPDDIDILSRPVSYLTWEARAIDGRPHRVSIDFSASGEIAVNTPDQQVRAEQVAGIDGLTVLRVGSVAQPVLAKAGDDLRIDWGYLYLAAPSSPQVRASIAPNAGTPVPGGDARLELSLDLGNVAGAPVSCLAMLAYDDLESIQYLGRNLRAYWRRGGWEAANLLAAAAAERESLLARCAALDKELTADLTKAGGAAYARLCAVAYRQCFAAGKFVADAQGRPLQFSKENHSNGCIATADVFYPMSPQFLLFGPTLAKSFLIPFMDYAASPRWKFPFAPHDLGTYPHANGQRYGGGERTEENQMPVEECGNLLILLAAVAHLEGNADFAGHYWKQTQQWAEYLKAKGFDPENQLCTDDFAGHLAHNVNLSAKAIVGLGCYAKLCAMRGERAQAAEYAKLAREFAERWVKQADDGDHFRLAFDRPGTWSQKYNLVWDRILGLGLFPDSVRRKELDYYLKVQQPFGLPLDNRKDYTKLDWTVWTATLTQQRRDFDALLAPLERFVRETPDRAPLTDWFDAKTARKVGFTARPVIGGVFLQLLYDRQTWAKHAGRERAALKQRGTSKPEAGHE